MITIDLNNQQLLFVFFIIFLLLNVYLFIIYKKDRHIELINKDNISIGDDVLDYLIDREMNYYMSILNITIDMIGDGIKNITQDKLDELKVLVIDEVIKYTTFDLYNKICIAYNIKNKEDYRYIIEKKVYMKIYTLSIKQFLAIRR